MTFKEKIDKLLTDNELKINSPSALEEYVGASVGSITKYYRKNEEPGTGTIKKILTLPGINRQWWDTGKGEVFIAGSVKNHTSVQNPSDNTRNMDIAEAIRVIIGGSEYFVIPKVAMEGKYRLMPLEEITIKEKELERRNDELIRKDTQIQGLYELVKVIALGASGNLPKIEDAQKNASV